ncbi:MAG: mechanosensitive ion channel family protein [Candidatus Micrarchaeia archaeon]
MVKSQKGNELVRMAELIIASAILIAILYALLEHLNLGAGVKAWVQSLLALIFGIGITLLISRAIKEYVLVHGIKQEAGTISTLFSIVSYGIVAIIALYLVHVNVTGLLVSAGFLGIVLGLAAQSTLGNIFSGISMIIAKPFAPGDYITVQTWQYNKLPSTYPHEEYIPGYAGTVTKIGLLYTELLDETKEPLYVPNGILNQALVINHRRAAERVIRFRAELNKSVPFDTIRSEIMRTLKDHGAGPNSFVSVEHVSENTYGLLVTVDTSNSNVPPRAIRSAIFADILKYSATKTHGRGK